MLYSTLARVEIGRNKYQRRAAAIRIVGFSTRQRVGLPKNYITFFVMRVTKIETREAKNVT